MARLFGLEVDVVTPTDIQALVPLAFVDDLVGGVLLPNDGQTNPIDTTQALAKGARSRGVKIVENVKVNKIVVEGGRAVGVSTDAGDIGADAVVNCAGMWARELADGVGAVDPVARRRTLLHRHRTHRCALAGDAGAARPGRLRVLQGGCRQAARRMVRARGQAVGHEVDPRIVQLRFTA